MNVHGGAKCASIYLQYKSKKRTNYPVNNYAIFSEHMNILVNVFFPSGNVFLRVGCTKFHRQRKSLWHNMQSLFDMMINWTSVQINRTTKQTPKAQINFWHGPRCTWNVYQFYHHIGKTTSENETATLCSVSKEWSGKFVCFFWK